MTRSQLVGKIARQTGYPVSQVENVIDLMVDNIIESLQEGDKVTIAGFGRFEMRQRKTKSYTNPKTKQHSQLAPTAIPGFKASGLMKTKIAGPKKDS